MKIENIGIIGGGSWATALIKIFTDSGALKKINWYIRNLQNIEYIRKHNRNKHYLSSILLDTEKIEIGNNLQSIIHQSDTLIISIPAAFLKETLLQKNLDLSSKKIISAVKGMIPDDHQIIFDFFNRNFNVPIQNFAVLTGPCHAEEIALERLSYLTVASENVYYANLIAKILNVEYINVKTSDDIYGTEYASVLKNIYALMSGICNGLGYGDNFQAVLVSSAIREIEKLLNAIHPISRDIKSSAYLGDLLVTSYSKFSRNRTFGSMIGKGYSVQSALLEMSMIPEGYFSLKSIYEINQSLQIDIPIINAAYNILYLNKSLDKEIKHLADLID
jgi:glycerol-3-phosphate dehydrogenase (NAD(P)+)